MEKLTNGSWVPCTYDDLSHGDQYRINAGGGYQQQQHVEVTTTNRERSWRDLQLSETDWIVPITDHPQHAEYLTYRQELRDYPQQPDFPNGTRPTI